MSSPAAKRAKRAEAIANGFCRECTVRPVKPGTKIRGGRRSKGGVPVPYRSCELCIGYHTGMTRGKRARA
jgi:hypothetical protein